MLYIGLCVIVDSCCFFFSPTGEIFVNPIAGSNLSSSRDTPAGTVTPDGFNPSDTHGATYETKVGVNGVTVEEAVFSNRSVSPYPKT